MLPMMVRQPMSSRRRRLLGRSLEAVCEGGDEHLADLRRCEWTLIGATIGVVASQRLISRTSVRHGNTEGGRKIVRRSEA